jgi:hypothetical protein
MIEVCEHKLIWPIIEGQYMVLPVTAGASCWRAGKRGWISWVEGDLLWALPMLDKDISQWFLLGQVLLPLFMGVDLRLVLCRK